MLPNQASAAAFRDAETKRFRFRYNASTSFRNACRNQAPLAQLDRASGYEPEGREFESLRAHHISSLQPSKSTPASP
jgi:hypothetical protein